MFAPKFGTRLIRLSPPVRPVSLNGLTGGPSCSQSGNGHTGLTGGLIALTGGPRVRVELRSPCEFRAVKGFLAGQDLPHPINIKGHGRLRWHHPIDHYFLQLLSLKP
jgi:hypothetical protein